MDRQIVYPGSIPLDTDILSLQRNTMVALGYLVQATLGTSPVVDGLACTPTSPASLTVQVGPGSIVTTGAIDASPFGSLAADASDPLVKMGINTQPVSFTLTSPAVSGQSIAYLIQASLLESDASPVVLPYYNAANPAQPFSGQANSGTAQNTQRLQRVQLQVKPGTPANAGAQTIPAVDTGWVGLYVITVPYGQTQLTTASIAQVPGAPFVPFKLPALVPGFSRQVVLTGSTSWTVPNGVTRIKVALCGAGGGGGSGSTTYAGSGGGAGGYAEGIYGVVPGQSFAVVVGIGGIGGSATSQPVGGGSSTFGALIGATGGGGGLNPAPSTGGGAPGAGFGGTLNMPGGYGGDGCANGLTFTGEGGASYFGGGGRAANGGGGVQQQGQAYGSGGGGTYYAPGNGGTGANGVVIIEY